MSWYDNLVGTSVIKPLNGNIEALFGFKASNAKSEKTQFIQPQQQLDALKKSKAWDIATGPAKQIPMNLFMSYMSGNSLQMIPISMTLMLFTNAITAIIGINKAFTGLESDRISNDLAMAKSTFLFFQMLTIGIGIYKLNSMGLIPNKTGDWLAFEVAPSYIERSI